MAPPISIKLRCNSWKQLAALYKRDLTRSAVFLKSSAPPPLETPVRINLTLPNRDLVILSGVVHEHIPPGGLNGRGPGVDIKLPEIPEDALAKIHAALEVAQKEGVAVAKGGARAKPDAQARQDGDAAGETADSPGEAAASAGQEPGPMDGGVSAEPAAASRPSPPPISALDEDILGISDSGPDEAAEPAQPASMEDGPAPRADDADELHARLEQERESLRKLNAFQILGVGYETTDEAVHEAFASLSERYHPDRFAGQAHEVAREIATEIFALIRAAHRLLESSEARERLRKELTGESRPEQHEEEQQPVADADNESAPSEEQSEIPTKPVLVAEDGTLIGEASQDGGEGEAGVPAAPQEEIPTKPAVANEGGEAKQQTSPPAAGKGPATPPPIPTAKPPPIPKTRPAPPPVPAAKTRPEVDDDDAIAIALDEVQVPDSAPEEDIPLIDLDEDEDQAASPAPAESAEEELAGPAGSPGEAVAEEEEPAPPAPAEDQGEEQPPVTDQAFAAALGLAGAPLYAEAIVLLEAGDFKGAASVYRVASRRDPDELGARVGYELSEGLKAMANRDRLEAAQRFEAALEMDPDNQRAAAELGEIRRQIVQERADALKRLRNLTEE